MRNAIRFGFSVVVSVITAACGAAAPDRPAVEVVDSAGVRILVNGSEDVHLDWRFEPVLVLGGADDGPESFYQVGAGSVGADAAGNLYILDRGNHHVLVFDGEGSLTGTFGREGGGPGELQMPNSLLVWPDGAFGVADIGKRGLVRFNASGEPQEEELLENWFGSGVAQVDGTLVVPAHTNDGETGYSHLIALNGEARELVSHKRPPSRRIDLGCGTMVAMSQVFAPYLVWAPGPDFIAAATAAEYVIDIYREARKIASVRRVIELRQATRALAVQEEGDAFSGGGRGCSASAERVVQQRGVAEVIPAVGRIAVAPDGTLWVQRREVQGEDRSTDIFAAGGQYLGTLPPGTPFPVAFMPDGVVVTVERDDFDVPRVVVYEIVGPTDPLGKGWEAP